MKRLTFTLFIVLTFVCSSFSQTVKTIKGKVSSKSFGCASIFEEGEFINTKNLKGRIQIPTEQTIIFGVYKISKEELKVDSYGLDDEDKLFEIYETNEKGEFFIKNLPDGYYLLKFGVEGGEWNCFWIKVQVSKKSKDRKIDYELSLGI